MRRIFADDDPRSTGNYGWKDPHAYGCVAAGFASFIICLIYGKL